MINTDALNIQHSAKMRFGGQTGITDSNQGSQEGQSQQIRHVRRWVRRTGRFSKTDPPHLGMKHSFTASWLKNKTDTQVEIITMAHPVQLAMCTAFQVMPSKLASTTTLSPNPFQLSSLAKIAWYNGKYIWYGMRGSGFKRTQPWASTSFPGPWYFHL